MNIYTDMAVVPLFLWTQYTGKFVSKSYPAARLTFYVGEIWHCLMKLRHFHSSWETNCICPFAVI